MSARACQCLGCQAAATRQVLHPERGPMVVCDEHADDHQEVIV